MKLYGRYFEEAVATELRSARARKRLTEDDVAQKVGIHRVSVSRYLSGVRSIPIPVLAEICDAIGVDTFEIVNKAEIAARKRLSESKSNTDQDENSSRTE